MIWNRINQGLTFAAHSLCPPPLQKVMSAHSEKLLEVELELRALASLRDELEKVRLSLDAVRSRLGALEQGGRSAAGTVTLGQR